MDLLLTVLLCVPTPPSPEAAAKPQRVLLYYIPFAVETYLPVTAETIRKNAHYTLTLESPERLAALKSILSDRRARSRYDPNFVRLLVVRDSPGTFDVIVDSEGQTLEGAQKSALSPNAFASLKRLLSELTAGMKVKGARVVTAQPRSGQTPIDYFLKSESNAERARP
jgi:hypothetical protein